MPARLSRGSGPAVALVVVAAALAAGALAPRRTLVAATSPGALPRHAATLHPVAALPTYRTPAPRPRTHPVRRVERRVAAAATPTPPPAGQSAVTPTATPQPTVAPAPTATPVAPEPSVAPPRATPVAPAAAAPVRTPARTFDSSGSFDSSR